MTIQRSKTTKKSHPDASSATTSGRLRVIVYKNRIASL
jgi:hypothetical protein